MVRGEKYVNRRVSPKAVGRIGEADRCRPLGDDPSSDGGWLEEEILKVLMGADVEFGSENFGSTCVEEE
ncbi:hypothetical protein DDQ41_12135 [Streptomyces spongiicola]|uniref:Uncharacterized protein n=1 Tax=Streptomyces spongiicola TaxID=1690221 RepID=A0ABN5KGT3_9ACTN|nr:hypothetical protein DDQ41_12135 [Streptomyces spongiicola]